MDAIYPLHEIPAPARSVMLAGASGLVGSHLLQGLLEDDSVTAIHALSRRVLPIVHPKLHLHVVDFRTLPSLPPVDEAYLALGTTIKAAGSRQAFRAVDFDASLAAAKVAQEAGASRLGVVSAMGANAHSLFFYNRVKGHLEDALTLMGFDGLLIARPSLLTGDRAALGQPARTGETLAQHLGRLLRPLTPANYRPIAAQAVARALLTRVPLVRGKEILLSGAMQAKNK